MLGTCRTELVFTSVSAEDSPSTVHGAAMGAGGGSVSGVKVANGKGLGRLGRQVLIGVCVAFKYILVVDLQQQESIVRPAETHTKTGSHLACHRGSWLQRPASQSWAQRKKIFEIGQYAQKLRTRPQRRCL